MTLAAVIGVLRTRLPVAWWMALQRAAATPTIPISPTPSAPSRLSPVDVKPEGPGRHDPL
jgi:hypothetical protein